MILLFPLAALISRYLGESNAINDTKTKSEKINEFVYIYVYGHVRVSKISHYAI